MDEAIQKLISYVVSVVPPDGAVIMTFAIIGIVYVVLTILKPVFVFIVGKTATEKDNAVVGRIYQFLDAFALSFEELAGVFKKRYPDAAELAKKARQEK